VVASRLRSWKGPASSRTGRQWPRPRPFATPTGPVATGRTGRAGTVVRRAGRAEDADRGCARRGAGPGDDRGEVWAPDAASPTGWVAGGGRSNGPVALRSWSRSPRPSRSRRTGCWPRGKPSSTTADRPTRATCALLCPRHHTIVHQKRYTATVTTTEVTWHVWLPAPQPACPRRVAPARPRPSPRPDALAVEVARTRAPVVTSVCVVVPLGDTVSAHVHIERPVRTTEEVSL
jgi:hypothetical protein